VSASDWSSDVCSSDLRDTIDQDFAQNRQRFLAEQGYAYRIIDADEIMKKN
jgi:DNA excision repair protein ERCC-3